MSEPFVPEFEFMRVLEIDDGAFVVDDLFRRKFGHPAPTDPIHLVAVYRAHSLHLVPVGYLHLMRHESIALVGGGCTDGKAFEFMLPDHRRAISDAGGTLFMLLRHAFCHYAGDFDAFFGHVGDARAEAVDLAAGFVHTGIPNVVEYYPRLIEDARREKLREMVTALGAF